MAKKFLIINGKFLKSNGKLVSGNEPGPGPTPTYPTKGQLINLNLDGTSRQYRVLNINGSTAEILSMYTPIDSIEFNTSENIYEGGELDIYLNSTWYGDLTATAKSAIVDKTFTQDSWYCGDAGDPHYPGYYGTTKPGTIDYIISLGSTTYGSSITRHVYALSVQDVLNYVKDTTIGDGELQNYNIWKMFWNDEVQHSEYPWLRSADAEESNCALCVSGYGGNFSGTGVDDANAARPALTIDLSKISWSPVVSSHTLTPTFTNVTGQPSSAIQVQSGGSQTFVLTADGTSYKLPTKITVASTEVIAGTETVITNKCTVLFTRTSDTSGSIAFSNVTDDVAFSVVGESVITEYSVTMVNTDEGGHGENWNVSFGCDSYAVGPSGDVHYSDCTNVKRYENSVASPNTTHTINIDRKYIIIEPDMDFVSEPLISGGISLSYSWMFQRVYRVVGNCVISASSWCLTGDTLITMVDNSTKRLDEIELGDEILSYNWETMQLVPNKVIFTDKDANKSFVEYDKWTFDDGTIVKTVHKHEFYNVEAKRFKYMDEWEIGEHTYKQDGTTPMLISHETIKEEVRHYKITGELGTNYFANGLLTGDRNCPKDIDLINKSTRLNQLED